MARPTNDTTTTGKIVEVRRLRNSVNGNPAWRITLNTDYGTQLTMRTKTDTAVSLSISEALVGNRARVTANGRREIWNVETL